MPWKDAPNADYRTIKMTQPLTVQQFYNNAIDYAKRNNVQFFKYNVVHSNCQAFLNVCLTANSKYLKYTPDDKAFIMQDVGAVLAESPYIEGLVGHVTGLRDKINIALNGKGRPKRHVRYTNKLAKRLMV
jgi:hypothetical protein